jgi:outer membrane protein OmpA-like peptidoglycan-associated protein
MSVSRRIKKIWNALRQPGALRMLYQGAALAPRLIVNLGAVAAIAGLMVACVPATQYEEAKSASEVELAGRQRAEADLAATQAKLTAANADLSERDAKLAATEESVSESKLENSVALKERDEATGLVDQLRGELGRVGDDLRSYAQQKAELEKTLEAAVARKKELEQGNAHAAAMARLMRDLTSALGERVLSGDVAIDVADGQIVLSAPSELWFADDAKLVPGADGLLAAIARVLVVHADSSVEVTAPGGSALGAERAQALSGALGAKGVTVERIKQTPAPDADSVTKPSTQVRLAFSVK